MSIKLWLLTGPLASRSNSDNADLWRWLASGRVHRVDDRQSIARRVLAALGHAQVNPDRAAIRYLAHANPAPDRWIAAADPVYLEPRLDHLCLHRCDVSPPELLRLSEHVNRLLADDGTWQLEAHGNELYYVGSTPIPTSTSPSAAIDGLLPNEFMPLGDAAADYRRLLSEFEMALHEHPVNLTRAAEGRQPVNSLWLWGGGELAALACPDLPDLLSDDPHLVGVWVSSEARTHALPEQLNIQGMSQDCVVGPIADEALSATLAAARAALKSGGVTELSILSRDGFVIEHRARDWMRLFRRPNKDLI